MNKKDQIKKMKLYLKILKFLNTLRYLRISFTSQPKFNELHYIS